MDQENNAEPPSGSTQFQEPTASNTEPPSTFHEPWAEPTENSPPMPPSVTFPEAHVTPQAAVTPPIPDPIAVPMPPLPDPIAIPAPATGSMVFSSSPMPTYNQPPSPPPSLPTTNANFSQSDQPTPVVKVLSVRGVEYLLMMFNLWMADAALLWIVIALINGQTGFTILAFPVSMLIVSLPIFGYLFLRLKKAELIDPNLRFDPSKRRTTQLTMLFTFLVCVSNVIGFIYILMGKIGGESNVNLLKAFLTMLAVLVIIGGLFVYYWIDEHKIRK